MPQIGSLRQRPAAANLASAPRKRPAAASSSRLAKSRAVKCRLPLRLVFSVTEGAPAGAREALEALHHGRLHPGQHEALKQMQDLFASREVALQKAVFQCEVARDNADRDVEVRLGEQRAAEENLAEQRRTVHERKEALANAVRAISAAAKALEGVKVSWNEAAEEFKVAEGRKLQLETAERSAYNPLKENAAKGPQGQKLLRSLRKIGEEFEFHDVLMAAVPPVLQKQPERRRTFDSIAMQQLEATFSKHIAAADAAMQQGANAIAELQAAMEAAEQALVDARQQREDTLRQVAAAEEAVAEEKGTLRNAQMHTRDAQTLAKTAERDLNSARTQLTFFQNLPKAALAELFDAAAALAADDVTQTIHQAEAAELKLEALPTIR